MTDRQTVDLSCVLKQCEGFEFSMKATTDRLRLQHFIYTRLNKLTFFFNLRLSDYTLA